MRPTLASIAQPILPAPVGEARLFSLASKTTAKTTTKTV
ncbi:hypothetical protein J2Z31_004312 [Sinorhizobium kostiense]|uniref:Uncharacterized protein n=1 Tax=Sinorhizobium kostiense TaxID=76747 RepID=A0ABS4R4H6_9HYPH|nr:hypothetical protein [Sinorhizobium kostiense]